MIQTFDRWQPVEVLHNNRWVPALYTRPVGKDDSILAAVLLNQGLVHSAIPDLGECERADEGAYRDTEIRLTPIRRGDVVQWQNDISNRISTGTVLRCRDGRAMIHLGHTHTSQLTADLARIGRARYYPDGTTVED